LYKSLAASTLLLIDGDDPASGMLLLVVKLSMTDFEHPIGTTNLDDFNRLLSNNCSDMEFISRSTTSLLLVLLICISGSGEAEFMISRLNRGLDHLSRVAM
jgi:hypothetical protein